MERKIIPLRKRKWDIVILVFYIFNLVFITYLIDLEQVVIPDTSHFTYPLWPPQIIVDLAHWYGRNIDPLLFTRPVWWRMTIWLDVLVFGPYYAAAIYAFIRGREWIRVPAFIMSSMLITNVIIILGEEAWGPLKAPDFLPVFLSNLPWILFPVLVIFRLAKSEHPFTSDKEPL